jgi:hypothetical protein
VIGNWRLPVSLRRAFAQSTVPAFCPPTIPAIVSGNECLGPETFPLLCSTVVGTVNVSDAHSVIQSHHNF